MTYEELREIALAKIEKALSMELDADITAMYIQALGMLKPEVEHSCGTKESVKV